MLMTKKSLVATVAVAASAMLLSACSSSDSDTTPSAAAPSGDNTPQTTLTVWVDAERAASLSDVASDYEASTGIAVEIVSRDNATLKDDFIQQANSGSGPDVVMGAHDWLGELTTNGVIAPVELGDTAANYLPVAVDAAAYDGTVYLLPYGVENVAVLRNADLVPEPAATWDDMIAAGTASGAEFAFVVEQGEDGNPYHLYPLQTAFGAPVFGRDDSGAYDPSKLELGNGGDFAAWLSSQGVNGANTISTEITGDIAKDKFLTGEAAFWLTGPWNVKAATDAGVNVVVDRIPSPTDQPAQPFAGVKGFFVNQYSENKVAANDFLVNYIGTVDVQKALYESGGVLPALTAAADEVAGDPLVKGFKEAGEDAVPMPAIPEMGVVWEYWGVAQAQILNGADPAATWAKLTEDVQNALSGS